MSEPALLADHLDQHTGAILGVWRSTVERVGDVAEADRLTDAEFADHIPDLIDRLSDRLRGHTVDATVTGRKHGQVRWRQGYDIADVVTELGHLRTALCRATADFAKRSRWDLGQLESALEAINDVLDEATAESVRQFQQDSRSETQQALAEVKRRQHAIEEAWVAAKLEKAKLRTILGSLPVAVWVVDAVGNLIGINDEAIRLQGLSRKEELGEVNVHHLDGYRIERLDRTPFPHEDLPIRRALRGETVTQAEMVWFTRGAPTTIAVNAAPLTDAAGSILGAVAVIQDVTNQKRLEDRLAASEAQFRTIAEKSPVMIWRTDLRGGCDYVNQAWVEFRGRRPDPEPFLGWADDLHPDDLDRCLARFRDDFARRESFELTYRRRRCDGAFRWISDRGTPYYDADARFLGYLGSCLDITERIDFEDALEAQRAVAEEASRHKTRLVSALSHDARTPLNAVGLAAQLLETHFDDTADDEVKNCLRTIRHSVRNVLDLLGDLLNLSKIDAGALPPEVSRFPVELVLAECLASIEPQARLKRLAVRLEPGPLGDKSLETDRSKLKQILSNLLSNALRYTDHGHIRIYGELAPDRIRIAVEDTGIGIAPGDLERIFDEFSTLDQSQRADGGTGLGLAICRRLASLLNGEILVTSTPGKGSTFTIALPLSTLTLNPPVVGADDGYEFPDQQQGAILVAEDHDDSRHTLARVLRRMGYRVLEASHGREVLALARQEHIAAILMDVNMPIMNGIEATLALRADPALRGLPIFALTGDVTLDNQHRIDEAGIDGYLEKPVTWEALKQALGSIDSRARN